MAFPSNWTLSGGQRDVPLEVELSSPPAPWPREWTLSTIPESVSDATETESQATSQDTIRGAFPIALSQRDDVDRQVAPFNTFEQRWTLPPRAASERAASEVVGTGTQAFDKAWSYGASPQTTTEDRRPPPGTVPEHVLPQASVSPANTRSAESAGYSVGSVPSGVYQNGYIANISPQSNLSSHISAQTSAGSSSLPANGLVRRLAGQHHFASPASAASGGSAMTSASDGRPLAPGYVQFAAYSTTTTPNIDEGSASSISPQSHLSHSYQPPRPAGFTSSVDPSPHSAAVSETYSQPGQLPRPAGFGPDNTSPPTSSTNSMNPSPEQASRNGVPNTTRIASRRNHPGGGFPAIDVSAYPATLPANVDSWLRANAHELYRPPAPLTVTAPWHSMFHEEQASQQQ
ncbi:uncharacterized protein E0L32_006048 [Thyridium curvatum]|uniref:Uncharacterized protein n=1 Tax=Thyridium curvatum TaxID=1093900 RepID=A0A507B1I0_9PEZI|nr:uncharacterized protein E0L32_006048 [Thyridium curvatum]TPX13577.1 hypothetical protein E0L32_006048 [Thyridium curvatum]